jgi:putative colanic acid biosynthesis acetyltransferase WcaF
MSDSAEHDRQQEAMATAPPARRSAWTAKQKIIRLLWGTIGRLGWQFASLRPAMLRLFGGTVGSGCRLARRIEITIPWNISLGDDVVVHERAILYSLGMITIGSGTIIDVRAHLCAGSHDMRDTRFPLTRPPITVGARNRIGVDAYIAPDVTLGDDCVVHHRASVYKSFPDGTVVQGNPARVVEPDA